MLSSPSERHIDITDLLTAGPVDIIALANAGSDGTNNFANFKPTKILLCDTGQTEKHTVTGTLFMDKAATRTPFTLLANELHDMSFKVISASTATRTILLGIVP